MDFNLMVKKSNNRRYWLLSLVWLFSGIVLFNPLEVYSKKSNNEKTNFKIVKQKIRLLPLQPLSILGLNSYLIKNSKDEAFLVLIYATINKYSWYIDTLKISKDFIKDKENNLAESIPLNVYLNETLDIIISVKKFNSENCKGVSLVKSKEANVVNLPYFIAINNNEKKQIIVLKQGKIPVDLNNRSPIKIVENIKVQFNEKDLNNLELLLGFKQSSTEYNALINYLNNYNKSRNEFLEKNEYSS